VQTVHFKRTVVTILLVQELAQENKLGCFIPA